MKGEIPTSSYSNSNQQSMNEESKLFPSNNYQGPNQPNFAEMDPII